VDVSRVAREFGGGGHPQAAGFSTAVSYPELVDQLRSHIRAQLSPA
jgi:phosphoesterase RecJ-like protein